MVSAYSSHVCAPAKITNACTIRRDSGQSREHAECAPHQNIRAGLRVLCAPERFVRTLRRSPLASSKGGWRGQEVGLGPMVRYVVREQ